MDGDVATTHLGVVRAIGHVHRGDGVDAPRVGSSSRRPMGRAVILGGPAGREGSAPNDRAHTVRRIDRYALAIGAAGWAVFTVWDCWR